MKAHESPAADRDARRRAGHHVVVAGAVIALVVAGWKWTMASLSLTASPAAGSGVPRSERRGSSSGWCPRVPRISCGASGFGSKALVVRRSAVHPDEDATLAAAGGAARSGRRGGSRRQGVNQAAAEQGAGAGVARQSLREADDSCDALDDYFLPSSCTQRRGVAHRLLPPFSR